MLTMVSHYLVQGWLVPWVKPLGSVRVGAVDEAVRCDKEGVACDCASDSAALVDGYGG